LQQPLPQHLPRHSSWREQREQHAPILERARCFSQGSLDISDMCTNADARPVCALLHRSVRVVAPLCARCCTALCALLRGSTRRHGAGIRTKFFFEAGLSNGRMSTRLVRVPYDTLCFSGAHASCTDMLACVHQLAAENALSLADIRHFVGTSTGALAALVLFCGYEVDRFALGDLGGGAGGAVGRVVRAFESLARGERSADTCRALLRGLLQDTFGAADVTLAQLHAGCGSTLTVATTHAETGEPVYVSHATFPHVEAADACMASMYVPGTCAVHMLRRGTSTDPKAFVPVCSGYFSDPNPFAAAFPGARVLNVVPAPHAPEEGHATSTALSLLAKRNAALIERLHADVDRHVVHVREGPCARTTGARASACETARAQPPASAQVHARTSDSTGVKSGTSFTSSSRRHSGNKEAQQEGQAEVQQGHAEVLAIARNWSTFPDTKRTFLRAFTALDPRFDEWRRADETCAQERGRNTCDYHKEDEEEVDCGSPGALLDAVSAEVSGRF
jgi:hypothetical protein